MECKSHSVSPRLGASALELSLIETSPPSHCQASALSVAAAPVAAPVGDGDATKAGDRGFPHQRWNRCSAVSWSECGWSGRSSGLVGRLKEVKR